MVEVINQSGACIFLQVDFEGRLIKAEVHMKAVFWLGIMVLMHWNISFTFQAVKNLYAHPTYLCFGPFCKLFGDF